MFWRLQSNRLSLGRNLEAFTCAYACMVSMSSCALKRQTSVEVTSSERVPPGAERHTIIMSNQLVNMDAFTKHETIPDIYKLDNELIMYNQ